MNILKVEQQIVECLDRFKYNLGLDDYVALVGDLNELLGRLDKLMRDLIVMKERSGGASALKSKWEEKLRTPEWQAAMATIDDYQDFAARRLFIASQARMELLNKEWSFGELEMEMKEIVVKYDSIDTQE